MEHTDKRGAGGAGSIHKTNVSWKWILIPLHKHAASERQRLFFLMYVDCYE